MKLNSNSIFASIFVFCLVLSPSNAVYAGGTSAAANHHQILLNLGMVLQAATRALLFAAGIPGETPEETRRTPSRSTQTDDDDTPPPDYRRVGRFYLSPDSQGHPQERPIIRTPQTGVRRALNLDFEDEIGGLRNAIYIIVPQRTLLPITDLRGVYQSEEQIRELLEFYRRAVNHSTYRYVGKTQTIEGGHQTVDKRFQQHGKDMMYNPHRRIYKTMARALIQNLRYFMQALIINIHPDQVRLFERLFAELFDVTGDFGLNSSSPSSGDGDSSEGDHRRKRRRDSDDDDGNDRRGGRPSAAAASSAPVSVH